MAKTSILVLAGSLFLSGCALTEKQCVEGNWAGIGKHDGIKGQTEDYVEKHVKSCAKHGVSVDQSEWERGRQIGLQTYCTPQSAFQLGKRGRNLRAVCDVNKMAELQAANDKGQKYYDLTQDIESVRRDINDLRSEHYRLSQEPESTGNASRMNSIRLRILQLNLRIDSIELRRSRYAYL